MAKLVVESLKTFINEDIKRLSPKTPEEIADLEKRGFKMQRGKWKFQIDIQDIWNKVEEDEEYREFVNALIPILESKIEDLSNFVDEWDISQYQDIIDELQMTDDDPTAEDIDYILNMLYDWADQNGVWIKTII